MNKQFEILKCFRNFNILYSQSVFIKSKRKTEFMTVEFKDLMYHHFTEKYLVFWDGERYKKLLKENIKEIQES